jgi:hypothetical protein
VQGAAHSAKAQAQLHSSPWLHAHGFGTAQVAAMRAAQASRQRTLSALWSLQILRRRSRNGAAEAANG